MTATASTVSPPGFAAGIWPCTTRLDPGGGIRVGGWSLGELASRHGTPLYILDEADVRYFGSRTAVVYGKESKTVPLAGGKQERRCLVWTDTWLERSGKWQMIAVQDGRIDCPAK